MGAEPQRHGWQFLQSAAGGALAGVALLLSFEFLWSFLQMLGLHSLSWGNQAVALVVIAAAGGAVASWTRWSGSRTATVLNDVSAVVIRHALFFILLVYSVTKLMAVQFRLPYAALDVPLGDASGYALTWRFFGYSYAYEVFIATGELVGASLLLYWRTTTLGACILVGVLSNIAMVNFTHNLPVKLASTCYLVMAGFLIVPDLRRLSALFVENRPVEPRQPPTEIGWPRSSSALIALKFAFVAFAIAHAVAYVKLGDSRPTPISGAWTVQDGTDQTGEAHAWRVVYFERGVGGANPGSLRIGSEPRPIRFRYEIDADGRLRMEFDQPHWANNFVGTYELTEDSTCLLRGTRGANGVTIRLIRKRP